MCSNVIMQPFLRIPCTNVNRSPVIIISNQTKHRNKFKPPVPGIANISAKYHIHVLNKVNTDEGGIKQIYHGLSTCTRLFQIKP